MRILISVLALLGLASLSLAAEPAEGDLDYGDYSSGTLQVKAWEALEAKNYAAAVKYTEKCAELYEERAKEMQASLKSKPSSDVVHDYWALNDVGTSYFIRGEALMKLHKNKQALAAYQTVVDEFRFAQAWDPKGWFWMPADAARNKIGILEFKTKAEF